MAVEGGRSVSLAVDTHCHLFLMDADPAKVVAEARDAGVGRLICVGIDPETNRLTFPAFDPQSRQPAYKACAANVRRLVDA